MYKDELVNALARRTGLTKTKARDAVRALFGTRCPGDRGIIGSQLAQGDQVQIGDFGTFGTRRRTGQPDASNQPYFHASRQLMRRLEKA